MQEDLSREAACTGGAGVIRLALTAPSEANGAHPEPAIPQQAFHFKTELLSVFNGAGYIGGYVHMPTASKMKNVFVKCLLPALLSLFAASTHLWGAQLANIVIRYTKNLSSDFFRNLRGKNV